MTDEEFQAIEAQANQPPGELCSECALHPATGLWLPERYAPDYSPSSFSPSELVARCDRCVQRWRAMVARREARAACR